MTIGDSAIFVILVVTLLLSIGFLVAYVLFLLSLQKCLNLISEPNREMSPGLVWLNLIPVFGLGWMIYTVIKISESVKKEGELRNTSELGDGAYNVGLAMGICNAAGIIPYVNFLTAIAGFIFMIIYWVKISGINGNLKALPAREYQI